MSLYGVMIREHALVQGDYIQGSLLSETFSNMNGIVLILGMILWMNYFGRYTLLIYLSFRRNKL